MLIEAAAQAACPPGVKGLTVPGRPARQLPSLPEAQRSVEPIAAPAAEEDRVDAGPSGRRGLGQAIEPDQLGLSDPLPQTPLGSARIEELKELSALLA